MYVNIPSKKSKSKSNLKQSKSKHLIKNAQPKESTISITPLIQNHIESYEILPLGGVNWAKGCSLIGRLPA